VNAVALCYPCAYHVPHYTAQALRAATAAYATLARLSTRITLDKRTCSRLFASCPPLYCPGATRGDRGVRYARTIANAHRVS
jgi:hypothetical protein